MPRKKGNRDAAERRRVAWMLENQALWRGYGGGQAWINRRKHIVALMKADGLLGRNTNWIHVDVQGIVNIARSVRREAAAREAA